MSFDEKEVRRGVVFYRRDRKFSESDSWNFRRNCGKDEYRLETRTIEI